MGACWSRLDEAVLTCTRGLCFGRKWVKYQHFFCSKISIFDLTKLLYTIWTCFRDVITHTRNMLLVLLRSCTLSDPMFDT